MKRTEKEDKKEPIVILKSFTLDKLITLYSIVGEICTDYSRMTDGYSLATGDKTFENIPEDIKNMIGDRQRFFLYKNTIKEIIKCKITNLMENGTDEFKKVHT